MRRYLEPVAALSAVAYLALGCSGAGLDASGVGGNSGATAGTGTEGSTGSGGGSLTSEASDTAPAVDSKTPTDKCTVTTDLSTPTLLSIPRARATVWATQVRGEIAAGLPSLPLPSTLRGPELLNYYHLEYPPSATADIAVVAELHDTTIPGQMVLQIGVQAPPSDSAHRRPTSITVLVDTSKSMEGESLNRANAAVHALAESLNPGDVLNVVTTSSEVAAIHRVAATAADPALFPADQPLTVSGSGDVGESLARAYAAAGADGSYLAGGINRVVVITDGGGLPASIDNRLIDDGWAMQGIALVGVGVGLAPSYRPALLDAATSAGHGPNLYLDSVDEAEAQLHVRFGEVMDEALHDVSIGFQLPKIFEVVNAGAASDGGGQLATSDLGSGRSMVFRHAVSLCPNPDSAALAQTEMLVTLSWRDPSVPELQSKPFKFSIGDLHAQKPSYPFLKTSAIIAFTNALQSLQLSRFEDACQQVGAVHSAFLSLPADPELDSIAAQISAHPVMIANMKSCP